jgi:hypothetical protein
MGGRQFQISRHEKKMVHPTKDLRYASTILLHNNIMFLLMPQSLARVLLHIIFCTKNREPYFGDQLIRKDLHAYLAATANQSRISFYFRRWSGRSRSFNLRTWTNSKRRNFGCETEGQFQPSLQRELSITILLAKRIRSILGCGVNAKFCCRIRVQSRRAPQTGHISRRIPSLLKKT